MQWVCATPQAKPQGSPVDPQTTGRPQRAGWMGHGSPGSIERGRLSNDDEGANPWGVGHEDEVPCGSRAAKSRFAALLCVFCDFVRGYGPECRDGVRNGRGGGWPDRGCVGWRRRGRLGWRSARRARGRGDRECARSARSRNGATEQSARPGVESRRSCVDLAESGQRSLGFIYADPHLSVQSGTVLPRVPADDSGREPEPGCLRDGLPAAGRVLADRPIAPPASGAGASAEEGGRCYFSAPRSSS